MAAADHRVRAFRLSRNFGKEAAICAGLAQVRSAGVIVMDSDLQHPPVLIREMVRAWREEGFDVVEAVKTSSRLQSTLFHRLFQLLAGIPLKGASDFKFMNRRVLNAWADLPERTVFFRGMSAWLGFRRKEIPFVVPKRSSGGPKWSTFRLIRLALDSITSFSSLPVHVITLMGLIFFVFAVGLGTLTLYYKITGVDVTGFTTVIILQLIIGSMLMIALGIVGQYISKIYHEVKGRPRFIVAESTDHEVRSL